MAKKTAKKKAPKRSSKTSTTAKKTAAKKTTKKKATKKASPKKKATKKKTTKSTKRSSKPVEENVGDLNVGDLEVTVDRRRTEDRREEMEQLEAEPQHMPERRAKVARRRQIDPTTCERDYSNDEIEFMHALDEYKRRAGRMFPTCSEILEVVRDLGYRRLTPEEIALLNNSLSPASTNDQTGENGDSNQFEDHNIDPNSAEAQFESESPSDPVFPASLPAAGYAGQPDVNELAFSESMPQEFEV